MKKKEFESHSTAGIHAKITREQQALIELGHTEFAKGVRLTLAAVFLFAIAAVPLAQFFMKPDGCGGEVDAQKAASRPVGNSESLLLGWKQICSSGLADVWSVVPSARKIKDFEEAFERESAIGTRLIPPVQYFLASNFGLGNEKAYIGQGGWLFYRPDVDYVTGPPYLDSNEMRRRRLSENAPQPDPRKAVLSFHKQLQQRGVQLVLMPTPVKPMIEGEHFSAMGSKGIGLLRNPSDEPFFDEMRKEGILIFDCAKDLYEAKKKGGSRQFLETDTHWTPEGMDLAAKNLASFLRELGVLDKPDTAYVRKPCGMSDLGDIAIMMKLPENQKLFQKQTVTTQIVMLEDGSPWRPERGSEILLLGDSFSNIYSLAEMGWGGSAGFAEQLSFHLQRPVDTILRNDSGAFATRQMLAQELASGNDRLAGKKILIWQFAARELSSGDWKIIEMGQAGSAGKTGGDGKAAPTESGDFFIPQNKEPVEITGTLQNATKAPKPGTVPYKDHIICMVIDDLHVNGISVPGKQAVVLAWSMRDNKLTGAAGIKAGERIRVKAVDWRKVEDKYGSFNITLFDDEKLVFAPFLWAEEVGRK